MYKQVRLFKLVVIAPHQFVQTSGSQEGAFGKNVAGAAGSAAGAAAGAAAATAAILATTYVVAKIKAVAAAAAPAAAPAAAASVPDNRATSQHDRPDYHANHTLAVSMIGLRVSMISC